jgi:mycothiol system anti-sigma-R factor
VGGFEPWQVSIGLAAWLVVFFAGLFYWGNRFKRFRRTTIMGLGCAGGALMLVAIFGINHSRDLPLADFVSLAGIVVNNSILIVAFIRHHLDDCEPCLREYGLDEAVKRLVARCCGSDPVPPNLRSKVLSRLEAAQVESTAREGRPS